MKILFIRSLPLERDSRSTKMVLEYRRRSHQVTALVWSRGETVPLDEETIVCNAKGGFGRRFRGLGGRAKWFSFIAIEMFKRRKDYDIIHVVDLDTAIVGVPISMALRKPVIYDAFDHIAAIAGGGVAGRILAKFERWAIRRAALGIFPDPIRLKQYDLPSSDNFLTIANIPDLRSIRLNEDEPPRRRDRKSLRLVYIGTLEQDHRGLEYLPRLCALYRHIEVVVGGGGFLEEYFCQSSDEHPNLSFIGHQTYQNAMNQMNEADILYGPYLLTTPAHRFASPNKMYEHLALAKPLLTNSGTPPGELVKRLDSGFLFDGSFGSLKNVFDTLTSSECRAAGERAGHAWKSEFSTLRSQQIDNYFARFDRIESVTLPQKR